MNNIIELSNVKKSYGKFQALKGIDLKLKPSEILGFIGPNGAGKSTTIKVILGMIQSEGSSKVFGLNSWDDSVKIHENLAYVPGDVNLWPNLTGGEVIDFLLMLKNQKNNAYKKELIHRFDLNPTKKCKTYSKGNRQKVALIAALSSDVDLYIFDEPTSGLDPLMETVFQEEVRKLKDKGKSILLSSHILSEVEQLCDTINIIKEGQIIEKGNLQDIRHLSMTNIKVMTEGKVDSFEHLSYIKDFKRQNNFMEFRVENQYLGEIISNLSQYNIVSFESRLASLEELFMGYYGKE